MESTWKPEEVGRKYELTRYAVGRRRIGGDGKWYGSETCKTLEEAQQALEEAMRGNRHQNVGGGIIVDFGPDDGVRYEYKIVKVVKQFEVLEVVT